MGNKSKMRKHGVHRRLSRSYYTAHPFWNEHCFLPTLPTYLCDNTSDHNYTRPYISNEEILPEHFTDHGYSSRVDNNLLIDMQYADDTTWLGVNNAQEKVKKVKQEMPGKLAKHNLFVNKTKTEEFIVKRSGDDSWKKCKLLGSLLDTEEDI